MSPQILFVLLLILMSALFHIIPGLTRPDLFFAVTVAPEFRRTSDARRILQRYRAIVWSFTVVASGLELVSGMALAAVLLQAMGFLWALVGAHRAARAYAATPSSILEVDLAMPQERLPGEFPVHGGMHGADHRVTTTPAAVFGLLAAHAFACLLLVGLAWGLLYWSRRISTTGAGAAAERSE